MLRLDSYVQAELIDDVSAALVAIPGVRHVTRGPSTTAVRIPPL